MTLFLAPIQIAERNRLTCFYRMIKLPEVPDLTILRPHGMIPARDSHPRTLRPRFATLFEPDDISFQIPFIGL